jgi:hypothetical protein
MEFLMLNKLYLWVGKNTATIILVLLIAASAITIFNLIEIVRKPTQITVVEGSIQHHLVWSLKGECFFVKPYSEDTVYLIRVKDCDRSDTTIKAIK